MTFSHIPPHIFSDHVCPKVLTKIYSFLCSFKSCPQIIRYADCTPLFAFLLRSLRSASIFKGMLAVKILIYQCTDALFRTYFSNLLCDSFCHIYILYLLMYTYHTYLIYTHHSIALLISVENA